LIDRIFPPRAVLARILIIDDNDDVRGILQLMLEAADHQVISTSSGEAGIVAFSAERPELVITDLHLTDMTGVEVIRALRGLDKACRIIMVSGTAPPQELEDASSEFGVVPNLPKPFKRVDLIAIVDRTLKG
jgi:CheY-like chemotaxis protein